MEKLSIIIPVYNSEKTILTTLKSIENNKSYREYKNNLNIIIIDDGSIDKSADIIKKYIKGKNNFLFIEKENSGAGSTRNVGLENVKDGFVTFLDSDDEYAEDFLSKAFENMTKNSIYIYNIEYKNKEHKSLLLNLYSQNIKVNSAFIIKYLEDFNFIAPSVVNKIYDANIIKKYNIKFIDDLKYGEDLLFNLQYLRYINSAILNKEALYIYNANSNSTMNTVTLKDKKFFDVLFDKLIQYAKEEKIENKYIYQIYFSHMILLINSILKNKQSIIKKIKDINVIFNERKMIDNIELIDTKRLNLKRKVIYMLYKIRLKRRKKMITKKDIKILLMNAFNTYNYGTMMMAENIITYFNKNMKVIPKFYIECTNEDNINRMKKATGCDIYMDKWISSKNTFKGPMRRIENFIKNRVKLYLNKRKYDVVIILGGDDYAETYCTTNFQLNGLIRTMKKVHILNKYTKLYMIGQTIGPYTGKRAEYAKKVFENVKIYARDEVSAKYMEEELGIKVHHSRDLALLNLNLQGEYEAKYKEILDKFNIEENNYITIVGTALSQFYTKNTDLFDENFIKIIMKLKEKYHDKKIVWLSHVVNKGDNILLDRLNNKYDNYINNNLVVIKDTLLPAEARIVLGHGYLTVTCRMHAAVSTLQMGKPVICLSYSVKYKGVIGDALDLKELVIECKGDESWKKDITKEVIKTTDYIDNNYESLQKKIKNNVKINQDIIKNTIKEIVEDIERKD